jgi:hypothetical protein
VRRFETIPILMPRISESVARSDDSLAKCVRDIEDAQSFSAATAAPSTDQILDRLEREIREALTDQMKLGSASC